MPDESVSSRLKEHRSSKALSSSSSLSSLSSLLSAFPSSVKGALSAQTPEDFAPREGHCGLVMRALSLGPRGSSRWLRCMHGFSDFFLRAMVRCADRLGPLGRPRPKCRRVRVPLLATALLGLGGPLATKLQRTNGHLPVPVLLSRSSIAQADAWLQPGRALKALGPRGRSLTLAGTLHLSGARKQQSRANPKP